MSTSVLSPFRTQLFECSSAPALDKLFCPGTILVKQDERSLQIKSLDFHDVKLLPLLKKGDFTKVETVLAAVEAKPDIRLGGNIFLGLASDHEKNKGTSVLDWLLAKHIKCLACFGLVVELPNHWSYISYCAYEAGEWRRFIQDIRCAWDGPDAVVPLLTAK